MSVVLYKKGDQLTINGLDCDTLIVEPELFDVKALPEGWFLSPAKAYEEIKENADPYKMSEEAEKNADLHIKIAVAAINKQKESKPKVLKGNAKIRNDAKEAGITDWKTARTETLKNKLKA